MSKKYSYIERKIPATPRNKRLAGMVTNAISSSVTYGNLPGYSTPIDTGDLDRMFNLDTEADEIIALKPFRSLIVKEFLAQESFIAECDATFKQSVEVEDALSVTNQFTLNNKSVTGISRGIDDPLDKPSPYKLATTDYVSAFVDERYLRKDIDDTAHGNITFCQSIHSEDYIQGFYTGRGWMVTEDGDADFNAVDVRTNLVVGNRGGSPTFISGFPNGIGWDLAPYQRINAADVAETKWRLEIDDINVRGQMRVYEMVISQLRGENDNVIFAGMMRVLRTDRDNEIIYLDTEKGVLYNPFRKGDILMCQRFGGMPSAENQYNVIKQYELRVKEAYVGNLADGEERVDWITVEKFVGDWDDVAERDVLTRVDSLTDSTRKGVVKVTTVDEIGAPYIDVVYGMKTDPDNATKVRMGNLSGVRTRNNRDLTGVWGLYAEGAVLENSTYYMQDGNTIEQNFTILNGKLESEISTVKADMSVEAGNILRNSSFGSNMRYWESVDEVHFMLTADGYIYGSNYFYVEKNRIADIVADNGRYVLRLRDSGITQANSVMNLSGISFEGTTEKDEEGNEKTIYPNFSFAFFYKPLTAGTLRVGFSGKDLYAEEQLTAANDYAQFSRYAGWDGTGDFTLSYTGEMLLYGVSLYNDKLADAKIYLEGKITQTAEALTIDYKKLIVDSENSITQAYTGLITTTAQSLTSKYDAILYEKDNEGNITNKLHYESLISQTASAITAELHSAIYTDNTNKTTKWDAKISATASSLTSKYDAILYQTDKDGNLTNTLKYDTLISQNATAISARVNMEDYNGKKVISLINLDETGATIQAKHINLIGKVTFNMLAPGVATDGKDENGNEVKAQLALKTDIPDVNKFEAKGAAEALRSAIVNGNTEILGGYISTNVISVDTAFLNQVVANMATIGGFSIGSNYLQGLSGQYIRIADSDNNAGAYIGVQSNYNVEGTARTVAITATRAHFLELYTSQITAYGTNTFNSKAKSDHPLNVDCKKGQGTIYMQGIQKAESNGSWVDGTVRVASISGYSVLVLT